MFLSDSSALMRSSASPAFETTSGRLLTSTSNWDCSDGITGYLRLSTADSRHRARACAAASRRTGRPVTPCSVSRATVSAPIGASRSMSATTRTRRESRGSMPMRATRPDHDAEVAHAAALRKPAHAALEVDLVALPAPRRRRCPSTRARSPRRAGARAARRPRPRRTWLPYPSLCPWSCEARGCARRGSSPGSRDARFA